MSIINIYIFNKTKKIVDTNDIFFKIEIKNKLITLLVMQISCFLYTF